jgi:RND family efflux transporter MFP subunit
MSLESSKRNLDKLTRCCWRGPALIATIATATLLSSAGCTRERTANAETKDAEAAVKVAVCKVGRADLSQDLRIAAEFKPFQEIEVHAKVAGYVKHIYVDVGDRVKKGQTLAILEAPELEHSLNQAEASSRQSTQEVERAQNELKRAQADHAVAHLSYTRLANVVKARPELVAQQEVDDAEGKDRSTEAQVAAARSGLASAQEHVSEASANRERVRTLLDYARITAPFDGVVTARYADTGAMLAAGTTSEQQALPLVRLSENECFGFKFPFQKRMSQPCKLARRSRWKYRPFIGISRALCLAFPTMWTRPLAR